MYLDGLNDDYLEPTSTGLSRFLLGTYNGNGAMGGLLNRTQAAVGHGGDAGEIRPPRYGAFVFGDRIMVNLTIEWDQVKDNPALFGMGLETVSKALPPGGGKFDVKVQYFWGGFS